jgi:SagB-type dehydrogenase family enzyme
MSSSTNAPLVLEYHERSKHRLNRYAPGPGRLDWANQPDSFREFEGAPRVQLPFAADNLDTRYNDVRRGALPRPRPFDLDNVAILLELALGLSAWKAYGNNRWALRCNPSSGNLHPTEGYVVCPGMPALPAGVYHYVSRDHVLEQRAAVGDMPWIENGMLIGLSSIYWREAWKYGMRAWRYCQHDCGHAIAAVSYAAAALGWQTRIVLETSDQDVAGLLGLDRDEDFEGAEREAPDVLMWVGEVPPPRPSPKGEGEKPPLSLGRGAGGEGLLWYGKANRLSEAHVEWRDIDAIHRATSKPRTEERLDSRLRVNDDLRDPEVDLSFAQIAKQRRSAVDFDGITSISAGAFFKMLACLMPRIHAPPWNALPTRPLVHPAMMVHRVDGLQPGLYVLLRDPEALEELKQAMRPEWLWQKVGPHELPLYFLLPHDLREIAKTICCHQEIARDSCFALGMIAKLGVTQEEPWRYRHLFWECGMLGHALYLEAEAAGIRATGIGCYFDDEMHALLGIKDSTWQSLYHFTMGGAVDDPRLSTLPPYELQP